MGVGGRLRRLSKGCGTVAMLGLVAAMAAGAPGPVRAEEAPQAAPTAAPLASPILTIDQDRLYGESLWGKRAEAAIQAETAALQAENRRIEAGLADEEKALTERRKTAAPDTFRALADDFDQRVTGIRDAQERKLNAIATERDETRQAFFNAALPVMARLLEQRGAVAILDSRAVFVSARSVDATDELRTEIDRVLGAGPEVQPESAGDAPAADGD